MCVSPRRRATCSCSSPSTLVCFCNSFSMSTRFVGKLSRSDSTRCGMMYLKKERRNSCCCFRKISVNSERERCEQNRLIRSTLRERRERTHGPVIVEIAPLGEDDTTGPNRPQQRHNKDETTLSVLLRACVCARISRQSLSHQQHDDDHLFVNAYIICCICRRDDTDDTRLRRHR